MCVIKDSSLSKIHRLIDRTDHLAGILDRMRLDPVQAVRASRQDKQVRPEILRQALLLQSRSFAPNLPALCLEG